MKKSVSIICGIAIGLFVSQIAMAQKVVGYYPTYANFPAGLNNVDLTKITHLNIAFANPDNNGVVGGVNIASLATAVNLAHSKNVKVFISIAGGAATVNGVPIQTLYGGLLSNTTKMNTFVANLIQYAVSNNLDGIDVDIEGNVLDGTNVTASQYQAFVTALGTGLHAQGKQMSAALGTWFANLVTTNAANQFDWINMMSYDAYGTWTGPGQHSSYQLAVDDLALWKGKGVAASKLTVGVPFYGYSWGTYGINAHTFGTLVNTYPGAENADQIGSGANVIYYNGTATIKKKTTLGIGSAGGVMIWELSQDATGSKSLLTAIDQVVKATVINTPPTVNITSPTNNAAFNSPASITINATAADADGNVTKVVFYNGTNILSTVVTAPYAYTWTGVTPGTYAITAKATDNSNAETTSGVVNITVTGPSAPIKEYTVNKITAPVTVDGVLDETGWADAPYTDNLLNMDGTVAAQAAKVKMLWSDTHLYYAIVVNDNSIWSDITARDGSLWTQDVVELLIDKDGDGVNYNEIGFAPNGTIYDLMMDKPYATGGNGNMAWNITGINVKSKVTGTINTATGGTQWICEIAIPYSGIPVSPVNITKPAIGDTWRFNIARADHNFNAANSEKLYTWTYTDGVTNHLPSRFGKVIFGDVVQKGPYSGTPKLIPGKVETEEYDLGGEGVAYHEINAARESVNKTFRAAEGVDIEDCTEGTFDIGYTQPGEWLNYTVQSNNAASFKVTLRAANGATTITKCHIEMDGVNVSGNLDVSPTGGWQNWANFTTAAFSVTAGQHVLKLVTDADGANYNYMQVDFATTTDLTDADLAKTVIGVYPNPSADGIFNFSQIVKRADVYTVQGSLLKSDVNTSSLDLQSLAPGIYLLDIEGNFVKIIKK